MHAPLYMHLVLYYYVVKKLRNNAFVSFVYYTQFQYLEEIQSAYFGRKDLNLFFLVHQLRPFLKPNGAAARHNPLHKIILAAILANVQR